MLSECSTWCEASASLAAAPIPLDGVDGGQDLVLRQHPALMREAADNPEFQPLVYLLRPLVVLQHVGGQSEGQLGGAAAGIPPFQTRRGVISQIMPRVETIDVVVLLDIDGATMLGAPSMVDFHAVNEC